MPAAPLIIRILARDHESSDAAIRQDLVDLPRHLDRVDGWIANSLLGGDRPNVADFQVATTLALLRSHDALRPAIDARPAGALAQRVAPGYAGRTTVAFPGDLH
jgi:glutathione S-transferase